MVERFDPLSRRGFLVGTGGAVATAVGPGGTAAAQAPSGPSAGARPGAVPAGARAADAVDLVNPLTGALTTSPDIACGKTFPGAVAPFGLVQLSPDTVNGGDNGSGYSADMTTIEGFSFLHLGRVVRIFAGVRRQLRHLAALSDRPRTPSTRTILRLAMLPHSPKGVGGTPSI
ncbi:hypothetical protein [Streptomyces sp. NPDC050560]|uniref:hypothetical protein n=1 Tax=Streptomyces sp. NPDC050560 TaxID=3365630 RepID=UPI0037A7E6B3